MSALISPRARVRLTGGSSNLADASAREAALRGGGSLSARSPRRGPERRPAAPDPRFVTKHRPMSARTFFRKPMTKTDEAVVERGVSGRAEADLLATSRHLRNHDALVTRVQALLLAGGARRCIALFQQAAQFDAAYEAHSTLLSARQFTRAMRGIVTGVSEADVEAAVRAVAARHTRPILVRSTAAEPAAAAAADAPEVRINYAEFINAVSEADPTIGFQENRFARQANPNAVEEYTALIGDYWGAPKPAPPGPPLSPRSRRPPGAAPAGRNNYAALDAGDAAAFFERLRGQHAAAAAALGGLSGPGARKLFLSLREQGAAAAGAEAAPESDTRFTTVAAVRDGVLAAAAAAAATGGAAGAGPPLSEADAGALATLCDTDGDGRVSWVDLAQALARLRDPARRVPQGGAPSSPRARAGAAGAGPEGSPRPWDAAGMLEEISRPLPPGVNDRFRNTVFPATAGLTEPDPRSALAATPAERFKTTVQALDGLVPAAAAARAAAAAAALARLRARRRAADDAMRAHVAAVDSWDDARRAASLRRMRAAADRAEKIAALIQAPTIKLGAPSPFTVGTIVTLA